MPMKKHQPLQPDSLIDDMLAIRMKVNSQIQQQQQQQHLQQHHRLQHQNHLQQLNCHHKPGQVLNDYNVSESNYTEAGSVSTSGSADASVRCRAKRHMQREEFQQLSPSHSDDADPQGSSSSSSSTPAAAAAEVGGHNKSYDSDDSQSSSENNDRPYTNTMSIGERLRYDQHSICDMFGF